MLRKIICEGEFIKFMRLGKKRTTGIMNRTVILTSIIILCIMFNTFPAAGTAYESDNSDRKKIVRVGYYDDSGAFQAGHSDDERKSGYAYEYYQELAKYTGWTYEYIYGSKEEMYQLLVNGEVDIVAALSKTEARLPYMLFPDNAMGDETYYIFVSADRKDLFSKDISSLNGTKIGVKSNSSMQKLLENFASSNNIDIEIIPYSSLMDRIENMDDGGLDCIVTVENDAMTGFEAIYNIGSEKFYFAVNKNRPDILNELNQAQKEILSKYPYYTSGLQSKYFNHNTVQKKLTDKELEWLNSHSDIKVGYLTDYMPFCGIDKKTGEMTGLLPEVLSELSKHTGASFTGISYKNYNDMIQALDSGELDVIFPTFEDLWFSEQQNYIQTDPVTGTLMSVIYKGNYDNSLYDKIAISKGSPLQSFYLTINYPDSEQVTYDSWKDCLDAIQSGEVGCMLVNSDLIYRYLNNHEEYSNLNVAEVEDMIHFCFAVHKSSSMLYSIINKGLNNVDETIINDSIIRNSYVESRYTFKKFLISNLTGVCIFVIGFILLLILFFILYRNRIKQEQKILKEAYDKEKEYIAYKEEQFNIVGSLSRIYCHTYYIDMINGLYKVIADFDDEDSDEQFMDVLKEDTDSWIDVKVKEPYRKNLLDFLNLATLSERMQGSDSISFEYETEKHNWYRGSFISAGKSKSGELKYAIYAVQKINVEKKNEQMTQTALLDAYESANRANNAKSDFLARMSHDIRTPMNAIIGMTTIAAAHIDDRSRVEDCLKKITASGRHLLTLINEVLDMSKIESGSLELTEEKFNLQELVDNIITIMHPQIEGKNHTLKVSIENVEHDNVIGDSIRIQQVFVNIMGNAVKYTPEGGNIKLSVTEKPMNKPNIGCYEFTFEDNGIGMSKEFIEHIFEPFARENDTKDNHIQGTGLGLSIVLSIVQMMDGRIKVESEKGNGSKFIVTICLRLQEDSDVSFGDFINTPVLVVDDNPDACESTCILLDELGIKSEWVLSGKEALEKVRSAGKNEGYFAILMDQTMPESDGIETAREIRSIAGNSIPIIIMSGYDWSEIEAEARDLEISGFISKPLLKSRITYIFKSLINDDVSESVNPLQQIDNNEFAGKHILLVEDNEINAEIAQEILGHSGLTIDHVWNGQEAVDLLLKTEPWHYDLIFMDIQMPVMDGHTTARTIRASERKDLKDIPIIAMTANAFAEDVHAALNSGMNQHIAKPLDVAQVMEVMRTWIKTDRK